MGNASGASPAPAVPAGVILTVGVLAVSTGAIFARLAQSPALVTAAYRLGFSMVVIIPVAGWRSRREIGRVSGRDLSLAVLSGLFLAMHFATWISSLDYTSVANSVVLVNTNPLWVGLLTPVLTRDRVPVITAVAIVLSVAGAFVIGAGDVATGSRALLGDLLALAGSFCAALYLLLGRRLRAGLSLPAYVLLCYGSATVFLWIMAGIAGQPVSGFSPGTWLSLAAMALIAQLVGHTSYNYALKWVSPGMVAVSLLGEPVLASLMAYFLFDEQMGAAKLVGGAMILAAIYLSSIGEQRLSTGSAAAT